MNASTWVVTIREEGREAIQRRTSASTRVEALQSVVIAFAHEVGDERALAGTTDYSIDERLQTARTEAGR